MHKSRTFDMLLFICFLVLVGLGVAFVYSASFPKAMIAGGTEANPFSFAAKQIIFAAIGIVAMLTMMFMRLAAWRKLFWPLIVITAGLLLLAAFLSKIHGNAAWISIGAFRFQPSEFAKVSVILTMATFLAKRPWLVKSVKGLFSGPAWFVLGPVGLVVLQKDLGTALCLAAGTIPVLAMAGAKFRYWGPAVLIMLLIGGLFVMHSDRKVRIDAWFRPFDLSIEQGHQPRHGLIAVGSGGWLGLGFCCSRQKYGYLPGSENDYIFAIIAEELGFVWTVLLLFVPFAFIMYRGFTIAHCAPDEYSALVATGCTTMLVTQAILNMAVVLNLIPSMGVNLPFISTGGSSLIASMMMAGLLLNVSALTPERAAHDDTELTAQPAGT